MVIINLNKTIFCYMNNFFRDRYLGDLRARLRHLGMLGILALSRRRFG